MKTVYLVISLMEQRLLTDVSLSSTGINSDSQHFVIGKNEGHFDSLADATKAAEKILKTDACEVGVEIKTIYIPD